MSNRFHSKYHRQNHHSYPNSYNPDAGHDPIASVEQPFCGDFVLYGALSCFAPLSSTAGYFYTNNTALCAIGGKKGLHISSSNDINSTGIYVFSSGIGLSSYSNRFGANIYAGIHGIDVYGGNSAIKAYSPFFGINSYGGTYAGSFYSLNRGISAYGATYALDVTSPVYGLNSYGGTFGANIYSPSRAISAFGGTVGLDVSSAARGINVRGTNQGIVVSSPTLAISSGGGGNNIFNNKVGIFKTPSSGIALDVKGDGYFDGNLTITGDISAYGIFSYFDTKVTISSALKVTNVGTEAAASITQQGAYPVLVCYDSDESLSVPSFIVDGASKGWVGLGIATPTAPFNIAKDYYQTNGQPHIKIIDNGNIPKTLVLGTSTSNYLSPFIATASEDHLSLGTNNLTRVLITSSGNVGVGENLFEKISEIDNNKISILGALSSYSLKTDELNIKGNATIGTDTSNTLTVNAGSVNFPNATSTSYALILGSDANLYRSATDTLKTDDSLIVNSSFTVNGPVSTPAPVTVNAATKTVQSTETSLIFKTTNCTLTLPTAASSSGRWLFIKNVTANSVTSSGATDILPLNSETPTNVILTATAGKWVWLQCDGTYWIIMAGN